LISLIGVEHLGVDLDRDPTLAIIIDRVAEELILSRQVFEEPCGTSCTVSYAQKHRTWPPSEVERRAPFFVVLLPRRVDTGDRALAGSDVLLLGPRSLDQVP